MGRLGRRGKVPTIRILILGAEGVGKNSLESRFITLTYPPLYDPDLTVASRRLLNLSPYKQSGDDPSISIARQLGTRHGLFTGHLRQSLDIIVPRPEARRPRSASSTFSNLGSELELHAQDTCIPGEQDLEFGGISLVEDVQLYIPRDELSTYHSPPSHCANHSQDTTSYFVEITNYPALQSPKIRSQVLSKGHYDAVLLVYDVSNRSSFNTITALHAEIPLSTRRRKRSIWGRGTSLRKARSSIFASHGGNHNMCVHRQAEADSGTGEIVVSLVGNKVDLDLESDEDDLEYQWHLLEKEAVLQEADIEERSLVHPLYRESRFFDDQQEDMPLSPRSISLSVRSARSVPVHLQSRRGSMMNGVGGGGELVRRSVFSDGGAGRMSSFSAGRVSLNLVPEGNEHGTVPLGGEKKSSIERWMETGLGGGEEPVRDFSLGDGPDGHLVTDSHLHGEAHDIGDSESDTTAALLLPQRSRGSRREVSKLEGELLSRALLLNVPFHETSAKTGENVEETFEAVVREVLREMGHLSSYYWHGTGCCCAVTPAVQGGMSTDDAGNNRSPRDRDVAGSEKRKKRTLSKKRRSGDRKEEKRDTSKQDKEDPPVPEIVVEGGDGERREDSDMAVTQTVVVDNGIEAIEATPHNSGVTAEISPPSTPQKRRRRDSALERFRKVFTRKSEAVVSDIAVA